MIPAQAPRNFHSGSELQAKHSHVPDSASTNDFGTFLFMQAWNLS